MAFVSKPGTAASGDVQWQNRKDPETGRLMLGYGHCLTVDSAQGLTSSWHIDALPQGTAGITAYKAYVAESRHVEGCETLISEVALRQDVNLARPLGDPCPITEEDLWKRAADDMSAKPQKALGIDLLRHVLHNQEALIDDMMRIDARLDDMQRNGRNLPEEIFGCVEDIRLRGAIEPVLSGFENAVAARGQEIEAFRSNLAATLHELRERFGEGFEISQKARPKPTPSLRL